MEQPGSCLTGGGKDAWSRKLVADLPIYSADNMDALPRVVQGFTTRNGGVGHAPYDTLNLGLTCGDDPRIVLENREHLADALGFSSTCWAFAEQVHGSEVAVVRETPKPGAPLPRADALVTNVPGVLLALQFADCFPVYIIEPKKRVIALLHSGWRGTSSNIVKAAADALSDAFGVNPDCCLAAIGPGIAAENYEVDDEVAAKFIVGFKASEEPIVERRQGAPGKWSLHVRRAIFAQLRSCGYAADSIAVCGANTYGDADEFFRIAGNRGADSKPGA